MAASLEGPPRLTLLGAVNKSICKIGHTGLCLGSNLDSISVMDIACNRLMRSASAFTNAEKSFRGAGLRPLRAPGCLRVGALGRGLG